MKLVTSRSFASARFEIAGIFKQFQNDGWALSQAKAALAEITAQGIAAEIVEVDAGNAGSQSTMLNSFAICLSSDAAKLIEIAR